MECLLRFARILTVNTALLIVLVFAAMKPAPRTEPRNYRGKLWQVPLPFLLEPATLIFSYQASIKFRSLPKVSLVYHAAIIAGTISIIPVSQPPIIKLPVIFLKP